MVWDLSLRRSLTLQAHLDYINDMILSCSPSRIFLQESFKPSKRSIKAHLEFWPSFEKKLNFGWIWLKFFKEFILVLTDTVLDCSILLWAGTTEHCSHLFALFAVFNDFQKNELFALLGANSVNKRTANTFVGGPFVGGPEHLVRWSLNAGYSMSLGLDPNFWKFIDHMIWSDRLF